MDKVLQNFVVCGTILYKGKVHANCPNYKNYNL